MLLEESNNTTIGSNLMGNAQSLTRTSGTSFALDSFVSELGSDVVYERSLGSARFLKTVRCRHKNGYLVVKIFIKSDPGISLRKYHRRLRIEREGLADIANVYTYQTFVETDKAGYMIRQWVASSLYDRISTRPFLSTIEKKWIAFQLLTGLRDARNRKVSHGDLKTSNILITSWNWLFISDFASYKPAMLPLDDPADYSFFFDTSGRRICYIAPERFYSTEGNQDHKPQKEKEKEKDKDGDGKKEGKVTEAMDCFSAGCVLAELFLEGAPLFTLSQLFKYREGELNVDAQLSAIDDEGIRSLIKQMIAIDPATRPTFDSLLHNARGTVFPETFYSFLHNYVASVNELSSSAPYPFTPSTLHSSAQTPVSTTPTIVKSPNATTTNTTAVGNTGTAVGDDLNYESVEPYLLLPSEAQEMDETIKEPIKVEYSGGSTGIIGKPLQDILPVELDIPNRESNILKDVGPGRKAATEDGPALILLALVTANVRTCRLPSSKLHALDVFLALASHLTDEAKLDRMVPYIAELLHDDAPSVRSAAIRTLMQTLILVTVITPSNAAIFPEYIIPALSHLVRDPEVSVRCMYAQCVVALADTAQRYLEMGQALRAHGAYSTNANPQSGLVVEGQEYDESHFEVSYDASMQELQNSIQEHLSALLVDPSPIVKRAILHNISALCIFLGRQRTNDVLLSHMITYLNDRDWLLRYAFFDCIVDVAACAGGRSLEEYILPLMIQALSDVEETVVSKVLSALTSLCELGLFQKMRIWELMSATLGFLYHPNVWIRQGAAAFIAAAAKHLPPSDVWCILYPSLKHFLRSEIKEVDEQSLLLSMKPPISRQVFDAAVQWAMKADKTQFWRSHRSSKTESPRDSMAAVRSAGAASSRTRSEEDETQLMKLQQLGMTSSDEAKLFAMRDYILKLSRAIASFSARVSVETESENLRTTGPIELQKLGVTPQTIFLKTPGPDGAIRPTRLVVPQRTPSELSVRSPGTPRSTRTMSIDHATAAGAPFEDLRRRLAQINSSATSLSVSPSVRDTRSPLQPIPDSTSLPPSVDTGILELPTSHDIKRPSSPAESITSVANSSTFRGAVQFLHAGVDAQKAAPAVGSSRANATGLLLDAHMRMRDTSPERSGASSPVSIAGTIKGADRLRVPSVAPISTYDGNEAGISNLLEHLYLDNNRDLQADFGPRVHDGPLRRRNAGRHSYISRDGNQRRVETTLIAHLASHTDAITGLAMSPDHVFFVSASDDKTLKIWDTARLERNVTSKARLTYSQHHSRVKAVCTIESTHCFASAAEDGTIHIVRVHVTGGQGAGGGLPKYGKLQTVREHRLERPGEYVTSMAHFMTDASSNLVYATTHSTISILDIRTMRIIQTMDNPRHFGPITCICLDRKRTWIVCGTSTGVLSLWDLRFGVLIKSWKVKAASRGKSLKIHQCVVHPTKGRGKWILVAMEQESTGFDTGSEISAKLVPMVEVWDIESTKLVEKFCTRTTSGTPDTVLEPELVSGEDAEISPADAIAALVQARQEGNINYSATRRRSNTQAIRTSREGLLVSPSSSVRAIIVGTDFAGHGAVHRTAMADQATTRPSARGFMVTGSEDHRLRFWDFGRVDKCMVLSGPEGDVDKPTYSAVRSSSGEASTYIETWMNMGASHSNRPAQRLSLINHGQQHLLRSHQDTITSLLSLESPFRGGIVSGDRAGVLKVWRVEGIDVS
ncbi:Serine/threonine-protein kinase Vps15-like protein [Abortiporus biennis]